MKKLVASVIVSLGLFFASETSAQTSATTQCIASAAAQGTPNAITIAALPCALTTNLLILSASGANTSTTPTLQPLGLPAQTIVRPDGTALALGDIAGIGFKALLNSTGSNWVLLNPATGAGLAPIVADSVLCNATGSISAPIGCTTLPTGLQAPNFQFLAGGTGITTTDGSVVNTQNTSATANTIYGPLSSGHVNWDANRVALQVNSSTTNITTSAFGAYVLDNNPMNGSGNVLGAALARYDYVIANVDHAGVWGGSTYLGDSESNTQITTVARGVVGHEYDYGIAGNGTSVHGISLLLGGQAQPSSAFGFFVNASGTDATTTSPIVWNNAFSTGNGAAQVAFSAGAQKVSGTSIPGQRIDLYQFDSSGTNFYTEILANNHAIQLMDSENANGLFLATENTQGPIISAFSTTNTNVPLEIEGQGNSNVIIPQNTLQISSLTIAGAACVSASGVFSTSTGKCSGNDPSDVTSVSNSDGTLTISPTTGAVVASIALAHANTWSGGQTFSAGITVSNSGNLVIGFSAPTSDESILFFKPNGDNNSQGFQLGGDGSGKFFAFDVAGGANIWSMSTGGTFALTPPISVAGTVTFSNLSTQGQVCNSATGLLSTTTSASCPGVTGSTFTATNGSTPTSGYAVGDLVVNNTGSVLGKVVDVATGAVLVSGGIGALPVYSTQPVVSNITAGAVYGGSTSSSTLDLISTSSGTHVSDNVEITSGGVIAANWDISQNVQLFGLIESEGNAYTLTCGTGCASVVGNPQRFKVTTGSAVTSVSVNFGFTWPYTPVCVIGAGSTASVTDVASVSTIAITFGASVALTSTAIQVICM